MKNVIIPLAIILTLDAFYLTATKSFYNNQVKMIQGSDIKLKILPTLIEYVILAFGLYYFILKDKKPVTDAMLLGFVICSVFELTNLAIFDKWSIAAVLLDCTWGAILFGLTTFIVYKLRI